MVSFVSCRTLVFFVLLTLGTARIITKDDELDVKLDSVRRSMSDGGLTTQEEMDYYEDHKSVMLKKLERDISDEENLSNEKGSGDKNIEMTNTRNETYKTENGRNSKEKTEEKIFPGDVSAEKSENGSSASSLDTTVYFTEDVLLTTEETQPSTRLQQSTYTSKTGMFTTQWTEDESTLTFRSSTEALTGFQTSSTVQTGTSDYKCTNKDCEKFDVLIIFTPQAVLLGEPISLTCVTNTNISEYLNIAWYWQAKDGSQRYLNATAKHLHVEEATLDDTGKYTCVVRDRDGCCLQSASADVTVYKKPAYWLHISLLVGVSLGLVILVCIPMTVHLWRKYWQMKEFKEKGDKDTQTLML